MSIKSLPNMSNCAREFEEDKQFQRTIVPRSSNDSSYPVEHGGEGSTLTPTTSKKKRNHPVNPDPDAEVVALSPRTLIATNRYVCEVRNKGFRRDQNLQLHRRGHNLPWKLKQRPNTPVKKRVYVCPEPNCVYQDPSRALGDLTGIKKHFCRKHGEKKWKCEKCSKRYAVQSDWKAHTKICGTREYRCDCGTIFSRKDSFVTHKAFCDALAEENYSVNQNLSTGGGMFQGQGQELFISPMPSSDSFLNINTNTNPSMNLSISGGNIDNSLRPLSLSTAGVMISSNLDPIFSQRMSMAPHMTIRSPYTSTTSLLQKAAEMGAKISDNTITPILLRGFTGYSSSSINSAGSVQEGTSNIGPIVASANSFIVGEQAPTDTKPGHSVSQAAVFQSPHFVHSGNGSTGNLLGEVYMGGEGEKLTVDFLGEEPSGGNPSFGKKRSYDGNIVGLEYPNFHSDW